jgi:phosphatidylserine decarboxylase
LRPTTAVPEEPIFVERPTEWIVRDAWAVAAVPLAAALGAAALGWTVAAATLAGLGLFVLAFFRNPPRRIPGDERTVIAPADGRVIEVGEAPGPHGGAAQRVGIFLSVFDVHVNRMPIAGRVVSIERGGSRFLAAFDRRAERENVRCTLTLETAAGVKFQVVQITGLIARRIVCHPRIGEWIRRGERFGLIRFGSRTDVILPAGARVEVRRGQRVRGGSSVLATLGDAS